MHLKRMLYSTTLAAMLLSGTTALADMPKYVFFFLGDGMSATQTQVAEAYLTTFNGGRATEAADLLRPENRLNMSTFPVMGMQTTYDAHALMTDSASSATAFACGLKTQSGVIGMDDSKTHSYKSIAQLAAEQGRRVGVISSVSLDHATPASCYAKVPSRGDMYDIAVQLTQSRFDYFGGGGFAQPKGKNKDQSDVVELARKAGYTYVNSKADFESLNRTAGKVLAVNTTLQDAAAMPYEMDRKTGDLALADYTRKTYGKCLCAACAHFMLIKAYELAEASALQPFSYTQLVWVSLFGVTIFGETLAPNVALGGTIVVGAGLFTWWRSRQNERAGRN